MASFGAGDLKLLPGELHIWTASFEQPGWFLQRCKEYLNEPEKKRAASYRFARDRKAFIFSRSILRILLAAYSGQTPPELVFLKTEGGKPYIKPGQNKDKLSFNLSNSGNRVVYGIAYDRTIGIDIEYVRNPGDIKSMMEYALSKRELFNLEKFAYSEENIFFRYWTHKEALLKALGEGLLRPLKSIEFLLGECGNLRLCYIDNKAIDEKEWFIHEFTLEEKKYAGAVILKGAGCRVVHFDFNPRLF